jgi:sugar/nucleoside kinase (ribokinase family)
MGKQYDVYGVGNALVDMEFEVSVEDLQQLGIDKGVMTLVDEGRQSYLVGQLNHRLGRQSGGGSAANTMVAIAQLGGRGFYSCKVANDETGTFYLNDLRACGLESNLHNGDREAGTTGKCLVLVTPDADRTMNTFLGITGSLSVAELDPDAIANSKYLYLEGYLVTSPTALEAAIQARNIARGAGVNTALSLSDPNMVEFFKAGLTQIIGSGLDFLFANESEAKKMAGTDDLAQTIDYFKTMSRGFAITRGASGSLVFDGANLLEIRSFPAEAIDTVGAGDMYAGAFLYGITNGLSYQRAGTLASLASSRVVCTYGARLTAEELRSLVAEVL